MLSQLKRYFIPMVVLILLSFILGCASKSSDGSKDQKPVHAVKVKRGYLYYPDAQAYMDKERKIYYYMDKKGMWGRYAELPSTLVGKTKTSVNLILETEEPYEFYYDHSSKYPPTPPPAKEEPQKAKPKPKPKPKKK